MASCLASVGSNLLVSAIGTFCTQASEHVKYHRNLEKHLNILNTRVKELDARKIDVAGKIQLAIERGNSVREEAKIWVEKVEEIDEKAKVNETDVKKTKWLKRAWMGRRVCEEIKEVERVYEAGKRFSEGPVVNDVEGNGSGNQETGGNEECFVAGVGGIGETTIEEKDSTTDIRFDEYEDSRTNVESSNSKTVLGVGGIGKTNIKTKNSKTTVTFGKVIRK